MTNHSFTINSLKPFLQKAWKSAEFKQPTAVQLTAIPVALEGRDVIAESPTGTGKTLAYLLPLLEKVDPEAKSIQAVVLASSQELVMQIVEVIQKWSIESGIRAASFIGGANVKRQLEKLKKHPHIVVGTPGRMLELIKQKKIKMHEVKNVVLDEGDQLLVPEHFDTVKGIVKSTLSDRQVVLFSATLNEYTLNLAKELTNNPEIIKIQKDVTIKAAKVNHYYFMAEQREKIKILEKISRLNPIKGLVFVKDIGNLTVLSEKLAFNGIEASILHSDLNKMERQKALRNFRGGQSNLLIATDVAARGLDIEGISHVVHLDFPKEIKQYIHRSGRTGRFGASGTVISIVTEREERDLKKFCREMNIIPEKMTFHYGRMVEAKTKSVEKEKQKAKTINSQKHRSKK
ncbi:DEAD/DEAH box helicase [Bacillus sp. 03113]|uniref:DEAD/DEAH box helicase n=1 Tax=Bacillus sp. 03113 TaxID=2578211 RepID=UPI001142CC62|nr:DEAD/DEAH box helicase [Bacillus sp. 03113]